MNRELLTKEQKAVRVARASHDLACLAFRLAGFPPPDVPPAMAAWSMFNERRPQK